MINDIYICITLINAIIYNKNYVMSIRLNSKNLIRGLFLSPRRFFINR